MDNLIVNGPIVTDTGTLITGQNLERGAVLGKITATGKLTLSVHDAADGSATPYAVLNGDTDATDGDKSVGVILGGELNEDALTFGGAHTAATTKDGFRDIGIYLKKIG